MARHEVESEVQGNVWKVEVGVGDRVAKGDVLIILESMKMEIPVESPAAGRVAEMFVKPEEAVAEEQVLAVVEDG
jgi:biotin carboxyl carrier protein